LALLSETGCDSSKPAKIKSNLKLRNTRNDQTIDWRKSAEKLLPSVATVKPDCASRRNSKNGRFDSGKQIYDHVSPAN
jgi:hypothetical protein